MAAKPSRSSVQPQVIDMRLFRWCAREVKKRDMQQHSFTATTLGAELWRVAKEEKAAEGRNPHAVKMPHGNTLIKYRKLAAPASVKKPQVQNERRLEVSREGKAGGVKWRRERERKRERGRRRRERSVSREGQADGARRRERGGQRGSERK